MKRNSDLYHRAWRAQKGMACEWVFGCESGTGTIHKLYNGIDDGMASVLAVDIVDDAGMIRHLNMKHVRLPKSAAAIKRQGRR